MVGIRYPRSISAHYTRNQHFCPPSISNFGRTHTRLQANQQTHTWKRRGRRLTTQNRVRGSIQTKIAQRKQKKKKRKKKLGILVPDPTALQADTHTRITNSSTQIRTELNKEIDCAHPIHFPREGIPDFNGINLGTLARIIKNPVLKPLLRHPQQLKRCSRTSQTVNVFAEGLSVYKCFYPYFWENNKCVRGSKSLLWQRSL